MQLLQDVFIIEELQILSEGKANDIMKIRGVFGRCNEKNNNGRIYPTAVLENQLKKVQPLIAERRLCGELDHPQNDVVRLANASHLITKLEMKGNDLIGEAEVLKTPAGLTAKALVNGGVKIGISSRGMGTLSEDHNGDKIVNEDFRLITFDLVADPSTRGAYPALSESTQSKFARETQGKLQKESNFVTMLESKMRDIYKPWIEEQGSFYGKSKKQKEDELSASIRNRKRGAKGGAEARDLKALNASTEIMDIIKADGHWHRIAEMIKDSMIGEDSDEQVDEGVGDSLLDKGERKPTFVVKGRRTSPPSKEKSPGFFRSVATSIGRRVGAGIEHGGAERRKIGSAHSDVRVGRIKASGKEDVADVAARRASRRKGEAEGLGAEVFSAQQKAKTAKTKSRIKGTEKRRNLTQDAADRRWNPKQSVFSRIKDVAGNVAGDVAAVVKDKVRTSRRKNRGSGRDPGDDLLELRSEYQRLGKMLAEVFGLSEGLADSFTNNEDAKGRKDRKKIIRSLSRAAYGRKEPYTPPKGKDKDKEDKEDQPVPSGERHSGERRKDSQGEQYKRKENLAKKNREKAKANKKK